MPDPCFRKRTDHPDALSALTVNLHVSGSACDVSARMVVVGSMDRTSDIFHNLAAPLSRRPAGARTSRSPCCDRRFQLMVMGVVAHAGDRAGGYVRSHALWIQERAAPAHLFDTDGASATPIGGPGRRSRSRWPSSQSTDSVASVARAEANRRRSRARWSDGTLDPARLALAGFQVHVNGFSPVVGKSLEAASQFRGDCRR